MIWDIMLCLVLMWCSGVMFHIAVDEGCWRSIVIAFVCALLAGMIAHTVWSQCQ